MKIKTLTILLIIILAVATAVFFFYSPTETVLAPNKTTLIEIQDKQISENTNPFTIKINYPEVIGLDDFNQKVKTIIDKEIRNFKANSLVNDQAIKETDPENYEQYPREYELNVSYTKGQVDEKIVSIIFNIYSFEGATHGTSYFVPLNYNVKTKQEIKLADLFLSQPDYLQKISTFCVTDLTRQITSLLGNTSGTWVQEGASPKEENFQYFLINPDNTITFYFPKYQVAFGSAGDFKVIMPL